MKIYKGNTAKIKIGSDLISMLHAANLSDLEPSDFSCGWQVNNLDPSMSGQDSLFGHIAEALKALGYTEQYTYYCETGDPETAIEKLK